MSGVEPVPVLVEQVLHLATAVAEDLQDAVGELGLTTPLANLVWLLDPDADPVPLRQLAGRLHCDPSNVTLLSDRLEEKGIAERRPHPGDGRVRTLVLTPAGEAVRRRILEHVEQHSPLAALDAGQQRQLQGLLATALAGRSSSRTSGTPVR
ncbi:MarR family winged helix-turn-helix transcriptional regulator [Pseudonocardia sichuanensis]